MFEEMSKCSHETCFANIRNKCLILTDTRFELTCPFFKTQRQLNAEQEASKERLIRLYGKTVLTSEDIKKKRGSE